MYAIDDLKAWADRGAKTSTSDPGKGTVLPTKKHPVLRPYAGQERRWYQRESSDHAAQAPFRARAA